MRAPNLACPMRSRDSIPQVVRGGAVHRASHLQRLPVWHEQDRPEPPWGWASRLQRCSGLAATEQDLCEIDIATSTVDWATTSDCVIQKNWQVVRGGAVHCSPHLQRLPVWHEKDRPAQSLEPPWGRASRLQRCSGLAATEQDLCKTVIATGKVNWAITLYCVMMLAGGLR